MNTPPLLLGSSLVFWGWQTGLWFFAIFMAIIFEAARFIRFRWDISFSDFSRISDICTLIFSGIIVWLFISAKPERIIFIALQWLPLICFPLMLFQFYSAAGKVDVRALSLILRKQDKPQGQAAVNLTYPYVVLCILSAGAANIRTPWFYAGLLLLSAWALLPIRSARFSPLLWTGLLLFAGLGGYAGHIGLHQLQIIIEQKGFEWAADSNRDADPYRSVTAIGDIGTLKLSDRILLRVKPENLSNPGITFPLLLRDASYNKYNYSRWFVLHADFVPVLPEADQRTWKLGSASETNPPVTVSSYLRKDKGLLKLPLGVFQIEKLPVLKMELNPLGAVRIEKGPGLLTYEIRFSSHVSVDRPPDESDGFIPKREAQGVRKIVEQLKLASKAPGEILQDVAAFFQQNFKYSLIREPREGKTTALANFLHISRSGHCEYFATATVLLLRAAGIPTRYATGYLVHEFSTLEKRFVVREKDAHAWAMVYLNGSWHNFDTTPSSWTAIESDAVWKFLSDFCSWAAFQFSDWRWRGGEDRIKKHSVWLLIPLLFILARRLYFKKGMKRIKTVISSKSEIREKPGADSEFYLVEKRLSELGFERYLWETPVNWLKRIEKIQPPDICVQPLYSILRLHYICRFDPRGITPAEKAKLRSVARSWLA